MSFWVYWCNVLMVIPSGINQQDDMNGGKGGFQTSVTHFSKRIARLPLFEQIAVRNPRSFTSVWPEAQVQVTLICLQDVFETFN